MTEIPNISGSVPESYVHSPKQVEPGPGLDLPGAYLKWYEVHRADRGIGAGVREEARTFLEAEAAAGRLDLKGEIGFVLLHLCGDSFYFLLVTTWRGSNELWETVYHKDGGPFEHGDYPGPHRGTFCVWELGAIDHERKAWSRFLSTGRDRTALGAYLADSYTGEV